MYEDENPREKWMNDNGEIRERMNECEWTTDRDNKIEWMKIS